MSLSSFLHSLTNALGSSSHSGTASRIFISYRRDDARGDAGRLTDDLKEQFGEGQIFRDIEAIEPGVDFVEAINRAVGSCAVLLAIIGPNWLTVRDKDGRRRLDDPNDFIRLEIAAALRRNVRVIPVLVGDAKMPRPEDLPPELEALARRQAYELSDKRWEFDVAQLVATLDKVPGVVRRKALDKGRPEPGTKSFWTKKRLAWAAAAALAGLMAVIVSEFSPESQAPVGLAGYSPGTPAALNPPVSPEAETAVPFRPRAAVPAVNLSGAWRDTAGQPAFFQQTGNTLVVQFRDRNGVVIYSGSGTIEGTSVQLALTDHLYAAPFHLGLVVSPDGRSMAGTLTHQVMGATYPIVLYR
ncbi:MAG TPA: toll/interleukin-1 receptor domain-containing protein [Candidatus Acidoferrales bacterium]|nr:toll/interleukin-1 receptor domain-containing protein [Candidatus Acidoferrales bacterium]